MFSAEVPWCLVFVQKVKVSGKFQKDSRNSIFSEDPRSQKTKRRGCTGAPHAPRARQGLGRAQGWCGHPVWPPTLPYGLLKAFDLKTLGGSTLFLENIQISAAIENPISGTRNSVLAPCRDGELEEIIAIIITAASPSTIHDSPIHV